MRRVLLAAAVLAALAGVAQAGETVPPYKTMRALEGLEDRIAVGDALAQAAHGKAVVRIGKSFAAMPPETWSDLRSARALAAYLLSGGDGDAIARAIPVAAIHKDAAALYRGALAYAAGDDEVARAALMPIEPKTLPPGLAGHVALVQAALAEPTDKVKAVALLDIARLLAPGTLVEEAALRKEMALIAENNDFEKLNLLERRYQATFSRSVYAGNFMQLMIGLATREARTNTAVGNDRLARLLVVLGREDRRRLYLMIAREETLAGHLVSAPRAALEAAALAEAGGRDAARANLYFGASSLVGGTYDKALAALAAAAPERLDERDQTLRVAALDMAATIHAAIDSATAAPVAGESEASRLGEQALEEGGAVLRGGRR